MRTQEYTQSDVDTCMLEKCDSKDFTLISVTIDDFLISGSTAPLIQQLYNMLSAKYTVKLLGHPVEYLRWSVTYRADGSIQISQAALVNATITNAHMTEALARHTPYPCSMQLHPPTPADTSLPGVAQKYRQLVGYLR